MTDKLLALMKQSMTLRLVACYGAALMLGLSLIALVVDKQMARMADSTIEAHGNTVAAQLAQTALDAAMQQDMIALQAHLARLLKVPGIVSAAIYDLQDRLLAQAGATPSELHGRSYLHHFTAALALGDTMAGHVVVTLDTSTIEQPLPAIRWMLASIVATILLALVLISREWARRHAAAQTELSQTLLEGLPGPVIQACLPVRPPRLDTAQIRALLTALREHVEQITTPSPALLHQTASALYNGPEGRACLLLYCHNLTQLQRQVSRERLRTLLGRLQDHVETAARLYGGQRQAFAGCAIRLVFPAKTGSAAAAWQAVCCAHVLAGVLTHCRDEELGIQLQWRFVLDWQEPGDNELLRNCQLADDEKRVRWLVDQAASGELVVSEPLAAWLNDRDTLTLAEHHGDDGKLFYRIESLSDTHSKLLERQIEQLLAH